jgi:hypothetical protein
MAMTPTEYMRSLPPPLASIGTALQAMAALALECEAETARALTTNDPHEIAKAKARVGGARLVIEERLKAIAVMHEALAVRWGELLPGRSTERGSGE